VATAVKQKHYFRLAYGVLALAFWVSVAGFTYLMTRPDHAKSQAWSAWRPTNNDLTGAREIAQRVARQYRNDSGSQLVAIQEHPPEVQGLRLEAIGVRRPHRNGQIDPYIALYGGRRTLIYAFCGLGSNCSLVDTASQELDNFLRREALEVSLYSFKYLADVEQVVSLLPPTTDATGGQSSAVFLRKDQVSSILDHPLRDVLHAAAKAPSQVPPREANIVDALTMPQTYPATFEPLPDGDVILVLQRGDTSTPGS
jgi:hypothetical protein